MIYYSVKPKVDEHTIWVEITWKQKKLSSKQHSTLSPSHIEAIHVSSKNVAFDINNNMAKIRSLIPIWTSQGIRCVVLYLPTNLLEAKQDKQDKQNYLLQHILSSLMNAFFPIDDCSLVVTHDGKSRTDVKYHIDVLNLVLSAKRLAMVPGNIATPSYMCRTLEKWFENTGAVLQKYDHRKLKANKFRLINAVGDSAANKPCMLVVERKPRSPRGAAKNRTICIVGKGVTFDSGGLSLKSMESMKDMKYDKIGAIYAAAALKVFLEQKSKQMKNIHFVGIFPFAENAVSENALRPGDVIQSHSGKTVEITDPDAEGRLLLADAFSLAKSFEPDVLIDLATLTGHAESINCFHKGYFYVSPPSLRMEMERLTDSIGERMLAMPAWTEFDSILKSNVADMTNSPLSCSDSYTAALFLKQFVPPSVKTWLHIDLAHEVQNEIPSGYGVRTIVEFVQKLV